MPDGFLSQIAALTNSSDAYSRQMASRSRKKWRVKNEHPELVDELEGMAAPENAKMYWIKKKGISVLIKNEEDQVSYQDIRDDLIEEMSAHSPSYPTLERKKINDGHLMVLDPADIHIGKLCKSFETGEDYDSQLAVKRVHEGVQGIIDKSSGFNIDQILFVGGNDILHIDTPKRTTTSGTTQDTDSMWYDNFLTAKKLYVEVLEKLASLADVHFVYCPSNHDFMSGFMLCDAISAWFRNAKNITFDVSMQHRKYYRYHNNVIGLTHGDGAKTQDLPLLMAQESGEDWLAEHRYIYGHHVHHKTSKDFGSVCVETLRSPSGTDGWHHRNGYQHAPKAVEGFIHSKKHGQVARLSHLF